MSGCQPIWSFGKLCPKSTSKRHGSFGSKKPPCQRICRDHFLKIVFNQQVTFISLLRICIYQKHIPFGKCNTRYPIML